MHTLAILGLAAIGWQLGLTLALAAISLFVVGAALLAVVIAPLLRALGVPVEFRWTWTKERKS